MRLLFRRRSRRTVVGIGFAAAGARYRARGFTMVELLTVAVVMSTLARMAVPNFHDVLLRARAAEVAGDFETVRVAVMNYHADHLRWPKDGYTGQIPAGLDRYLPDGFRFDRPGYRIDWENWTLPSGLPTDPDRNVLLGISIVTDDMELGQAVLDMLGGAMTAYTLDDTYTFVVERM
ncbi:MAG TPA: prepilin-type N-terminal cleavage/methylation domain-containing protein [Longimicrobiales bacterium]|nr:prepilin-type N-terminal cleavage/methylation domain-containing protein [Longimicrobiales bacterium]